MNDFVLIENHKNNVNMVGNHEYDMLKETLTELTGEKVVVVTHVPPTINAIDLKGTEALAKPHGLLLVIAFGLPPFLPASLFALTSASLSIG
jgi:hypothetical protein